MKIETDLNKIRRLSEDNEDGNWEFRSFLKAYEWQVDDLDAVVHDLYRRVSAAIDCTKCANCCKTVRPVLDGVDIENCSAGLGITPEEFQTEHLKPDDEPGKYVFKKVPCPLLKSNRCSIYSRRPKACRSYPHLHKEGFVSRLWGVVDNCAVCPIAFNVYEHLKVVLWHDEDDEGFFDEFVVGD